MTTARHALRAAQLIYTNVEANESPTGRRGFQVWLATPALSEPLRRDVAKRLGDFKVPAGLPPADAVRHAYFACDNATGRHWVLAQTVPLAEKDMFGRGGRFYAHAYVLAEAEFARVRFNPFALLDGISFPHSPADAKNTAPQWQKGLAPEVELEPRPPADMVAAPPLLRELAAYLEKPEFNPIGLPEPTPAVLAFLRALFRWLPPALRREASFDTLSTGQSLSTMPYRFAGAVSIENFRRWTYRRTHRLELAAAKIAPPLPGDESYFGRLLTGWAAAGEPPPDDQMQALYGLTRALAEERAEGCSPEGIEPRRLAELFELPGVADCLNRLRAKRLEADLTDEFLRQLVQPLARDYLAADGPADALRRIAAPIPGAEIGTWIYRSLTEDAVPRLTPAEAQHLHRWLAERDGPLVRRCKLIALRWYGEVEKISAFLEKCSDDDRAWLRDWGRRSLAAFFPGDGELGQRIRDALDRGPGAAGELVEAELFLALTGADSAEGAAIRALIAYHRGQAGALVELLQGPFGDQLRDYLINRLELAEVAAGFRCCQFDGELHLGVEVQARGPDGRKLAALARAFYEQKPLVSLRFWLNRSTADLPKLIEGRMSTWLDPNGELLLCVRKERWPSLTRGLRSATDTQYQDFAGTVGGKFRSTPAFQWDNGSTFWVGARLTPLDGRTKAADTAVLRATLEAALPVEDAQTWPAPATNAAEIDRHRAAWLLKYLLEPLTMGKYAINR